ncbi:pentatricopeptide repeat-containing protein At4g35850, mitochondrial-like [Quercus robur]|uniref:pentatricopeptide repeat-containing protein At4g35850, mitochondrial-like n=1 Tax=Quercus robur TaxID=38942 RepID=UPI002162D8BE|nr:pentatricopeptide repeat-containing protein At4g35850, mitochondrial-like [Quercus robur]
MENPQHLPTSVAVHEHFEKDQEPVIERSEHDETSENLTSTKYIDPSRVEDSSNLQDLAVLEVELTVMETLLEMLKNNGNTPDVFTVMQVMRCYLHSGDIDRGLKTFEDYVSSGKPPIVELYVEREIPEDDPRLLLVSKTYDNLRQRSGPGPRRP